MFSEKTISINDLELNYVAGPANGPPLLLIHGGSARWQAYENIMPELAADYQLFALDLRGHGQSARAAGRYTLADYTGDIIAFIRDRIGAPPIVFGHSLGGIIALMVAAGMPGELAAVLVGDAPLTAATWRTVLENDRAGLIAWRDLAALPVTLEQLYEAVKDGPTTDPEDGRTVRMRDLLGEEHPVYDWITLNLYHQDPAVLTILIDEYERAAAGYEMTELMPAIDCPVLLLQADPQSGGLMTDAEVAEALTLLRQPTHIKLSGVSHVLHNEDKEAVMAALYSFLNSL